MILKTTVLVTVLVEEAIFLVYTKTVSQKVKLRKTLSQLPEMFLDVNQMKQVLVNLLSNAIHAMMDNADRPALLTITTVLEPHSLATDDGDQADVGLDQVVICKISDTGKGIKAEHLDKIFDPFFTTKDVGEGTGLGLSISYGIIEKHGGTINVESSPRQGSTFTVTLPVTSSSAAAAIKSAEYTNEARVLPQN